MDNLFLGFLFCSLETGVSVFVRLGVFRKLSRGGNNHHYSRDRKHITHVGYTLEKHHS